MYKFIQVKNSIDEFEDIKTKIVNQNPIAIKSMNEIIMNNGIVEICKKLSKSYHLFMITNQPDVSRGNNTKT